MTTTALDPAIGEKKRQQTQTPTRSCINAPACEAEMVLDKEKARFVCVRCGDSTKQGVEEARATLAAQRAETKQTAA